MKINNGAEAIDLIRKERNHKASMAVQHISTFEDQSYTSYIVYVTKPYAFIVTEEGAIIDPVSNRDQSR